MSILHTLLSLECIIAAKTGKLAEYISAGISPSIRHQTGKSYTNLMFFGHFKLLTRQLNHFVYVLIIANGLTRELKCR